MAFRNRDLSVLAYANGFTLWHWAGDDPMETVLADGYFNDVHTLMNTGDIIIINSTGTCIKRIEIENKIVKTTALK